MNRKRESGERLNAGKLKQGQVRSVTCQESKPPPPPSAALAEKLRQTPAVRVDKLARAKALLQDPSYPPASVIRAVAGQLAKELGQP